MAGDTRSRILEAALDMISRRGYEGTNLRDLAASLDLSKSALYRHFESKEAIWDALLDETESYYEGNFGRLRNSAITPSSVDELYEMAARQIGFTLRDPMIIKTRMVLSQEQFRDERIAKVASMHFSEGIEDLYTGIFQRMMAAGSMRGDDPRALAFEFISPGVVLIAMSDREPARTDEVYERICMHFKRFCEAHRA